MLSRLGTFIKNKPLTAMGLASAASFATTWTGKNVVDGVNTLYPKHQVSREFPTVIHCEGPSRQVTDFFFPRQPKGMTVFNSSFSAPITPQTMQAFVANNRFKQTSPDMFTSRGPSELVCRATFVPNDKKPVFINRESVYFKHPDLSPIIEDWARTKLYKMGGKEV
jgi:hypothetical protein